MLSCVMCPVSIVIIFFCDKMLELVRGGCVINRAYSVYFLYNLNYTTTDNLTETFSTFGLLVKMGKIFPLKVKGIINNFCPGSICHN